MTSYCISLWSSKKKSSDHIEVHVAYWRGCAVAVKMLYEELASCQRNIELLQQEVSIAWKLHHPNIAAVCGVTLELEDEEKKAWIVMDLLQASLSMVIEQSRQRGVQQLTLREKVDVAQDSLCGLTYLHTLVSCFTK